MSKHREYRRNPQVWSAGVPGTKVVEHFEVGLPTRSAGVQHQNQQVGLLGRLSSRFELIHFGASVTVTNRVEQDEAARDIGRLQLVARHVAGGWQDIGRGSLLAEQSIGEA